MAIKRTKRSVQIPLLKAAALALAEREGKARPPRSHITVTEVTPGVLYFWLLPLGTVTSLDVWDESNGGGQVFHMDFSPDGATDVKCFRRGDWEGVLLSRAKSSASH